MINKIKIKVCHVRTNLSRTYHSTTFYPHIQHAIKYQRLSSKAGSKYTNKLNEKKHQFTFFSNNYF